MKDLIVTYTYSGENPREVADAIRVEQTIEFPFELAPEWIQKEVVGDLISINSIKDSHEITIAYDPNVTGFEIPQLLNVLWGNVSLFPNVRLVDITFPSDLLDAFRGPRFGISGLRRLFAAPQRPLLTTAVKPMGQSPDDLAHIATQLVRAGFDIVKDDHSLSNQSWAPWDQRVSTIARAVADANARYGKQCRYCPSLNLPSSQVVEAAYRAKALGAGALLMLPGITGFDSMRNIAEDDEIALPIQAHPSMLGSMLMNENQGVDHGVLLGTVMRLSGADISIFPNIGGRFSFSSSACLSIAEKSRENLGSMAQMLIAPSGGMSLERIPEMITMYGNDVALLIGGALYRGDIYENARAMVAMVEDFASM
mgnify:FL=1|jgi:ribulose-bisphosphate carboxylase large chain